MEGIKNISSISGFSWADEVEKQEEEAKAQVTQQQKPNPFGSARPREVVLQEKGVDWRKLDQKLHESSNISYVHRKEKENIAATTALNNGNHHRFPSSNGWNRNGVPFVSQTVQNQNGVLVPPLKYPPKNTMGSMNVQTQYRSYNSYGSEFHHQSNFHDFNTNNSNRENGRRHFTGWELMHHQSAPRERELHNMHSNERGGFVRRNSAMERLGPFPIEASTPNNGGAMKSSATVKEMGRRGMEPEYENLRFAQNVDVEMMDFGGNCRKRAMESGFKNNRLQQRRRR